MARVAEVLDDLLGLPVDVLKGRQCAPVMRCADRTTLWGALRLRSVQLPYQSVIQPDRMPSVVHL